MAIKLNALVLGRKAMTRLDSVLQNRHHFANKGPYSQSYGFSSSYVLMWELDHKEDWMNTKELMLLNCGAGEDSRVPWTARRSNQSILKEIKSEYSFTGGTNAESPILWPSDTKSWHIGKAPWCWERLKAGGEDEMVGWHHWLNGHEFEQTLGDSKEQRSLASWSSWGQKNWTRLSDWTTTTNNKDILCIAQGTLLNSL